MTTDQTGPEKRGPMTDDPARDAVLRALQARPGALRVREIVIATKLSGRVVNVQLMHLEEQGLARSFRDGTGTLYWKAGR